MDRALVENITRLVISKLEEHTNNFAPLPLTEEELKRWNDISASMADSMIANPTIEKDSANSAPLPLTEEELERWSHITSSMEVTKIANSSSQEGARGGEGQVKFFQHYE